LPADHRLRHCKRSVIAAVILAIVVSRSWVPAQ
jgi:hypothetical protein